MRSATSAGQPTAAKLRPGYGRHVWVNRRRILQVVGCVTGVMAGSLFLTGCESFSDAATGVRQKLAERDAPHVKVFVAEPRDTFAAALKAVDHLGFRFLRGGPAQGKLEAASGLVAGKTLESTQQITLKAVFEPAPEGGTAVQLRLYEVIEADASKAAGQGVAPPLRDTPLYDSFFRELQAVLEAARKS